MVEGAEATGTMETLLSTTTISAVISLIVSAVVQYGFSSLEEERKHRALRPTRTSYKGSANWRRVGVPKGAVAIIARYWQTSQIRGLALPFTVAEKWSRRPRRLSGI